MNSHIGRYPGYTKDKKTVFLFVAKVEIAKPRPLNFLLASLFFLSPPDTSKEAKLSQFSFNMHNLLESFKKLCMFL